MLVINNALPREIAEQVRTALLSAKYAKYEQRKPNYYSGEEALFPSADEWYYCRYERSKELEQDPAFTAIGQWLVPYLRQFGEQLDCRAYKMSAGDHFRLHDDASNGIGFIYYLSKGWKWDWGGLLMVHDGREFTPIIPTFNQLVILDYKAPHFVSEVSSFAQEARYAIVGFIKEADGAPAPRTEQAGPVT